MALNFYVVGIDITRSCYTGLQLHVSCVQLVPLPSRGDAVSTHPGLRQCPLFISILFWFASRGMEPKWTGPTTKNLW